MLTEPEDLDRAELVALLERHWALSDPQLEYLPVGFGSHHWRAVDSRGVRRFVSVDDLEAGFQAGPDADAALAALDRAFRTAVALREEAELEFVVAPLRDDEGIVTRRVDRRYSVTVLPFVDGDSSTFGSYESARERREMGAVLGRLHAATDRVPAGLPRSDDFALPSRASLEAALRDLDARWETGPFAERARRLLRTHARDLGRRLGEYDEAVARVRGAPNPWVVTHGEPHRANVMRDRHGDVHLIDWDTTLIAPRERDLRMVLDEELTGWDEYVAAAGAASLDQRVILLYEEWWELANIGIFVDVFRRAHERTADTAACWENLTKHLAAR